MVYLKQQQQQSSNNDNRHSTAKITHTSYVWFSTRYADDGRENERTKKKQKERDISVCTDRLFFTEFDTQKKYIYTERIHCRMRNGFWACKSEPSGAFDQAACKTISLYVLYEQQQQFVHYTKHIVWMMHQHRRTTTTARRTTTTHNTTHKFRINLENNNNNNKLKHSSGNTKNATHSIRHSC